MTGFEVFLFNVVDLRVDFLVLDDFTKLNKELVRLTFILKECCQLPFENKLVEVEVECSRL